MTAPVPADQEEALREELRHAHARYLSARDVEATTYSCVRAAVEPIVEEIATLRAERDQLASELREAREERDKIKGKLGEVCSAIMPNLDLMEDAAGFEARAVAAEAEAAKLREALAGILPGKLCGESWDLPDTERMPIQTTLGALKAARAALSDPRPSPAKGDDDVR